MRLDALILDALLFTALAISLADATEHSCYPEKSSDQRALPPTHSELLEKKRQQIQDLLSDLYSERGQGAAVTLARTLLQHAEKQARGDLAHFVFLDEALNVIPRTADPRLALDVLDRLLIHFDLPEFETRKKVFEAVDFAGPSALGDPIFEALIGERLLCYVHHAGVAGDLKAGEAALRTARKIAKHRKNTRLEARIKEKAQWLASTKKIHSKVKSSRRKIDKDPSNQKARRNAAIQLLTLTGDWSQAREHLEHFEDPEFRSLMALDDDLTEDADTGSLLRLGRDLRTRASKEKEPTLRRALFRRSDHWYRIGIQQIDDDLEKLSVEKEILPFQGEFGPRVCFLADLDELDFRVGHATLFKNGQTHGREHPHIFMVGDLYYYHSIFLHPGNDAAFSFARYDLARKFSRLEGEVSLANTHAGRTRSPQVFEILGDGQSLWKSKRIQTPADAQGFRVDIDGVRFLELRVQCQGDAGWAHALWVEPRLSR